MHPIRKAFIGNVFAQLALLFGATGLFKVAALVALGLTLPVILYIYQNEHREKNISSARRARPSHKSKHRAV